MCCFEQNVQWVSNTSGFCYHWAWKDGQQRQKGGVDFGRDEMKKKPTCLWQNQVSVFVTFHFFHSDDDVCVSSELGLR